MNALTQNISTALEKFYDAENEKLDALALDKRYNRASKVGWLRDCPRFLVLARLIPEKYEVTKEQRGRFREGRVQEEIMRKDLYLSGVKIIGAEMDEAGNIKFPEFGKSFVVKDLELKGEIDDLVDAGTLPHPLVPNETESLEAVLDYKSVSSPMFHEVKKYDYGPDLRRSRFSWIRHYPDQLLCYMVPNRVPLGLLAFKNKEAGGMPHFVEIEWNAGDFSYIVDGLREINDKVKREDVPPALEGSPFCQRCGFSGYCFPEEEGKVAGTAVKVDNDDLLALLADRDALIKAGVPSQAKKLDDLTEKIKAIARTLVPDGQKGIIARVGDFKVITEKGSGRTVYNVPQDVKAKYRDIEENWKPIKIENLGDPL